MLARRGGDSAGDRRGGGEDHRRRAPARRSRADRVHAPLRSRQAHAGDAPRDAGGDGMRRVDATRAAERRALELAARRIARVPSPHASSSSFSLSRRLWDAARPDGAAAARASGFTCPGGQGAYPSSVLMNAIPARVAGVRRNRDGLAAVARGRAARGAGGRRDRRRRRVLSRRRRAGGRRARVRHRDYRAGRQDRRSRQRLRAGRQADGLRRQSISTRWRGRARCW